MSNELAILDAELPSYLRNRELDDITKALMGGSSQSGKRVSIKGGVWRLMVNGKEVAKNEDRDRKSTRLNSSHSQQSRMPSSA